MKIFNKTKAKNLWYLCGDFGDMNGEYAENPYSLKNEDYTVSQELSKNSDGVFTRKDTFTNTSDKTLNLSCLKSRFVLEGGEYEVYTQGNVWQNESHGQWHKLTTQIVSRSRSVRTCNSATPFVALWNNQTNRGIAFHLIPNCSWEIAVSMNAMPGMKSYIQVEMGIDADNLALAVNPGETVKMPEILYYEFKSKIDMDCWKLHRYCTDNMRYRKVPVMYNTWLYKFDKLSVENVMSQIEPARNLGCEYFVIDAGWFGINPVWAKGIGDWTESLTFGFKGNMIDVANAVRKSGLKFGLWLEIERAVDGSNVLETDARKYYIKGENGWWFLDFADPEARDYIYDITCGVIEKYGVEYIKFDFNADLFFDKRRSGFTEYFKGYEKFIKRLRAAYPDMYIDNCASGGMRMNLANCYDFDSFWHSDCQGIQEGMRLFKDAILRLPPQIFDRWTVIESSKNELVDDDGKPHNHIISTSDAICEQIEGVNMSTLKGWLSGGPLGFSCDLTALSELHTKELKKHIAQFKEDREFWRTAECHIAADTGNILILEFRSRDLKKIVVQTFYKRLMQYGVTVYPEVDSTLTYKCDNGKTYAGAEILADGIRLDFDPFGTYKMKQIILAAE